MLDEVKTNALVKILTGETTEDQKETMYSLGLRPVKGGLSEMWASGNITDEDKLVEVLQEFEEAGIRLMLIIDVPELRIYTLYVSEFGGVNIEAGEYDYYAGVRMQPEALSRIGLQYTDTQSINKENLL